MTEIQQLHAMVLLPLLKVPQEISGKRYAVPGKQDGVDLLIESYGYSFAQFDIILSRNLWGIRVPATLKLASIEDYSTFLEQIAKLPKGSWTTTDGKQQRAVFLSEEIGKTHPYFNLIYYDHNDQHHLFWGVRGSEAGAILLKSEIERNWFKEMNQ